MTANPILLQKKYARIIEQFSKKENLSLDGSVQEDEIKDLLDMSYKLTQK